MHLNIPALLVCSVVSLALGFVWFSILFRRRYGCEMSPETMTAEQKKACAGTMGRSFSIYIAASVVTAWAYAVCLGLWRLAAPSLGHAPDSLEGAAGFSLLLWAGFFAPFAVGKVIWMSKSWAVAAIEAAYELVRIGLMLLILWYWR